MNEKKVILITGGSRGIGSAIVKELANENSIIYFTYNKNKQQAEGLSKELDNKGYENNFFKVDISLHNDRINLVNQIIEKENKIDILINNAGITADSSFLTMSEDKWHCVIETNLNGTFFLSKEVAKYMLKHKKGKIINISSIVASYGNKGQANYIASKAAIEGVTRALALELSSRNITVNAVAPGLILTDMTAELFEKNKENFYNKIPLKRFGTPEDVAGLVSFLCSHKADYMTGLTIPIDGGITLNN